MDAAGRILRAEDGVFGSVDVSKIATGTEDELRFEIHGRHGAMRFNLMEPNVLEVYDPDRLQHTIEQLLNMWNQKVADPRGSGSIRCCRAGSRP